MTLKVTIKPLTKTPDGLDYIKKRGEEEIWMRENTPEMTKQKRGAHNNLVSCAAHKINETSLQFCLCVQLLHLQLPQYPAV